MKKAKIMIVEDELITAMHIKSELSCMGYEFCKSISKGEDAIKYVDQEPPDVILMDILLKSEMDGIEAAREIRARHDIPIIFTTGCYDEETRKLAEKVGLVAYLIKPVEIEDLKLMIDKAVGNRQ